jgi:hypothetical protein
VVEKRARLGRDLDLVARPAHVQTVERLFRAFGLAFGRAEGREIVVADQNLRGRMHRVGVEAVMDMPHAAFVEDGPRAPVRDSIKIGALHGRETRVEIGRYLRHVDRSHTGGLQMPVQRVADFQRVPVALEIDVCCLPQRVHARIGAPGGGDFHRMAAEFRECGFQRFLHRRPVGLTLPADETAAIVFEDQLVARHR